MSKILAFIACALFGPLLAALTACSSSGDNNDAITQPGHEAAVEIVSGNHQTALAGTELPQALVGRLIDAAGNALANRPVTFVISSGGGTLSVGATTSDRSGLVTGRWTLGPGAGTQQVDVLGTNPSGAPIIFATFDAIATAGAAVSAIAIAGTQGQAAKASTSASVGVSVVDLYGNAKPGVLVWFKPCEACGRVHPVSALTNAGGVATSVWSLGSTHGAQTLSAQVAGLSAIGIQALATPDTPEAAMILVARQGTGQIVDQHARNALPLEVLVSDARGAGVPGVAVEFAPVSGSAHFVPQTINTDGEGYAAFTGYFHDAGVVRAAAAVDGIAPAVFDLVVAPTPFEYDGDYRCRFANTPELHYSFHVSQNSVADNDSRGEVTADGSFNVERRTGDTWVRLQGKIELGIDGGAVAIGAVMDSGTLTPWTCERS